MGDNPQNIVFASWGTMRGIVAHILKSCLRLLPVALIIAFLFGIIGPSPAMASPGWYNTSWLYRKKITINSSNVTATLTNFPVLISLASDSDLASYARSDGYDILFTAADETTKLSHEIESYNGTTGKLVAWVKIPSLSSVTNTDIYMYYGNAGAGNQQDVTSVWDSNAKMVQHLKETTGGANAIKDSTANANNGSDNNSPTLGAAGKIDGAIGFSSATTDYVSVPNSSSLGITANITLEAWIYPTTLDAVHRRIIIKPHTSWGEPYYMYALWVYNDGTGNNLGFGISDGATRAYSWNGTLTANTWQHVAGTFNGTQMKWYINGNLVATMTPSITSIGTNTQPLAIGSVPGQILDFSGTIDEVRISSSARSADWIKTSYNNQSNPSAFFSLGLPQNVPVAPTVTTDSATLEQETTATLNGTLNFDGNEACQYSFEWGTTSGVYTNNISWTGSINTGQTFNTNLIGLIKGQPYYYRAKVINSVGVVNGGEVHFLTKPDGPTGLTATATSASQIDLSWTNGTGAGNTMVRRKIGSYPTSYTDGYQVYFNNGISAADTGLSANTTYFYRAWSEKTGSQQWSNTFVSANATTNAAPPSVIGGKVFTVNKAMVLAPWLLLAVAFSLVIIRLVQYLRKKTASRPPPGKNL